MTSQSNPPSFQERRKTQRRRVLQTGIIVSANGQYTSDCSIRDISETGARVSVSGQSFSGQFYLVHVRAQIAFQAKVVRANNGEIAMSFLSRIPLDENLDRNLAFLRRLCAERISR